MRLRTVLVVGGTGSLGNALVPLLLDNPLVEKVKVYSRGEHVQAQMARRFQGKRVDFVVGDVRDHRRLTTATKGCTDLFNLAAYKSIDTAEVHPDEAVKTNVYGTENCILAAHECGVEKAMFISTDKAVEPINLYGRTKAIAESEFIAANRSTNRGSSTSFSACRYGNVFGSNGSVLNIWLKENQYKVTDPTMTRFFISQKNAGRFVYRAWCEMTGGEVFIPKMRACTMGELFKAAVEECAYEKIGLRPGEKRNEVLICKDESEFVTDADWCFIRWPVVGLFPFERRGKELGGGWSLSSDEAPKFTDVELKEMVHEWKQNVFGSRSGVVLER